MSEIDPRITLIQGLVNFQKDFNNHPIINVTDIYNSACSTGGQPEIADLHELDEYCTTSALQIAVLGLIPFATGGTMLYDILNHYVTHYNKYSAITDPVLAASIASFTVLGICTLWYAKSVYFASKGLLNTGIEYGELNRINNNATPAVTGKTDRLV